MDISIQLATAQDFEAIYRLNRDALGYEFDRIETQERLQYILGRTGNRIFTAVLDGNIVGYAHGADYECTYSKPLKNILAIAVDGDKRGLGIGRRLLTAIENWAREDGCAGVRLVSGYNRENAHHFYLACGYAVRKEQKNFIKLF